MMEGAKKNNGALAHGIGLTALLAIIAKYTASLPLFSIMGQLVIAIILGIAWRAAFGVPESMMAGVAFSNKKLLRCGIILLGMRLNLADIIQAGPQVIAIAAINIAFTIFAVYGIAKLMKVEKRLALLTACGTAICGAAAVVAISPQIRANDDETAIGAATVAILGTIFTLLYTVMYPILGLSVAGYGIFSGATLHEVAHVIAAAAPVGQDAVDLAIVVKLTRVAMLVPVAILIGVWVNRTDRKESGAARQVGFRSIPIPWFIVGFLLTSCVNTMRIIPAALVDQLVLAAYLLIAMAMAGLGLNVDLIAFRRLGIRSFAAGLIGSVLLSGLGYALVKLFGLN
ncbi:YeiH family putative sulfate export transporter [Paenibacillus sp. PR3]|uniref:YeiH family putative sulfate export transporter n=1 Tax=Paenibacillus terricola TaxID=2763503 RepID=A0ABR8MWR0_9BACL|nr:YeiH family protein [Paenibacillus terricola]MBD3920397.1 YeiH family putative sulfate export transporter [Paenibacillus terricola]